MLNTKHSHKLYFKSIGIYLKEKWETCLIINHTSVISIYFFPKTVFYGLYAHEKTTDQTCANIWIVYNITVADLPIIWK